MKERKNEDMPIEEFPAVNLPHYDAPVGDPPVPNRAHTEMHLFDPIDALGEQEKKDLFMNRPDESL